MGLIPKKREVNQVIQIFYFIIINLQPIFLAVNLDLLRIRSPGYIYIFFYYSVSSVVSVVVVESSFDNMLPFPGTVLSSSKLVCWLLGI